MNFHGSARVFHFDKAQSVDGACLRRRRWRGRCLDRSVSKMDVAGEGGRTYDARRILSCARQVVLLDMDSAASHVLYVCDVPVCAGAGPSHRARSRRGVDSEASRLGARAPLVCIVVKGHVEAVPRRKRPSDKRRALAVVLSPVVKHRVLRGISPHGRIVVPGVRASAATAQRYFNGPSVRKAMRERLRMGSMLLTWMLLVFLAL